MTMETFGTRFHGNDERVDVESLGLSTEFWHGIATADRRLRTTRRRPTRRRRQADSRAGRPPPHPLAVDELGRRHRARRVRRRRPRRRGRGWMQAVTVPTPASSSHATIAVAASGGEAPALPGHADLPRHVGRAPSEVTVACTTPTATARRVAARRAHDPVEPQLGAVGRVPDDHPAGSGRAAARASADRRPVNSYIRASPSTPTISSASSTRSGSRRRRAVEIGDAVSSIARVWTTASHRAR